MKLPIVKIRVIGQRTINGKVALIAEESKAGLTKGQRVLFVNQSTYYRMNTPKSVLYWPSTRRGTHSYIPDLT